MSLAGKTILMTGAAGGIGAPLARALAQHSTQLILTDYHESALNTLVRDIMSTGGQAQAIRSDLLNPEEPERLVNHLHQQGVFPEILINLAGRISFNLFQYETARSIEDLWRINTLAPMQLTRLLLPSLLQRGNGQIVNIGSVYGSIGFAGFATYSASKFGLRGFSEALRRELEDTGVKVTYIAPRYVKTAINSGNIQRLSETLKVAMDEPQQVAQQMVEAIRRGKKEQFIGFPESLFVRINGALPHLVDQSLKKQVGIIRDFAQRPASDNS